MRRDADLPLLLGAAVGTLLMAMTVVVLSLLLVPRDGQPTGMLLANILGLAASILAAASFLAALLGFFLGRLRDARCAVVAVLAAAVLALLAFNP